MIDEKFMSKGQSALKSNHWQNPLGAAMSELPALPEKDTGYPEPEPYDPEKWKREWEARECFNAFKNHTMIPKK